MDELIYWHVYVIEFWAVCLAPAAADEDKERTPRGGRTRRDPQGRSDVLSPFSSPGTPISVLSFRWMDVCWRNDFSFTAHSSIRPSAALLESVHLMDEDVSGRALEDTYAQKKNYN